MKRRELLTGMAGGAAAWAMAPHLEAQPTAKVERPNILWLTIEDTGAHEFGCYGNALVKTPVIDALAARGTLFERAWSSGPQCSPSRSSIITGSDATTYASEWHRRAFPIPRDHFFPFALREAGYFCTNNPKTDYNATLDPKEIWDEQGATASYNSPKRAPEQPFYAVFNCNASHMEQVRSFDLQGRPDFAAQGIDPSQIALPAYVPDLPEVRSDAAFHLAGIQNIDSWVELFLRDLEAKGLAENTIVFFSSDHGGVSPRAKGFVYESGLRVPFIVYVPPKFRHLSGFAPGARSKRLVGLVDMGPTILSLAGLTPPARMQGRAFLGAKQAAPRPYLFAFSANQSNHFQPARAVCDGRFKLFRAYTPHKPLSLRNNYQWGMPANLAYDELVLSGRVSQPELLQAYRPHKFERLFDLQNDPDEINDLSNDPKHRQTLDKLSRALDEHARETADLGLFPAAQRGKKEGLYAWTRATNYPLEDLHEAAKIAARGDAKNLAQLTAYLRSDKPEIRFWGASGFATLGGAPSTSRAWQVPEELLKAAQDADAGVAAEAAHALCYAGRTDVGMPALMEAFAKGSSSAHSALETLSTTKIGAAAMQPYVSKLRALGENPVNPADAGQNDDAEGVNVGWRARGILVNLRELPVKALYGQPQQAQGRKNNRAKRPLVPVP